MSSFLKKTDLHHFTGPHDQGKSGDRRRAYFEQLEKEWNLATQPFTILEFLKRVEAKKVVLVHYSGNEDQKYYHMPMCTPGQLGDWVNEVALAAGIRSACIIPNPGAKIPL